MQIPYRNPIFHHDGKSTYAGDFELTDQALINYDVARDKFGSTEVMLPNGSSFIVKDYQYRLADGSVGMYFVPVSNNDSIMGPDKNYKSGFYYIDDFLRKTMNLKTDEPIYALINYFHPELNKGTIKELLSPTSEKIEMGFTHLGAYYGKGYTTNAPMLYHWHRFGVTGEANQTIFGYPTNVQIISLKNVPQVTVNKNLTYVDVCLNSGVEVPSANAQIYKHSKFRPVDINTALMFYRDWINYERYLHTDDSWNTYCAAHKTLVATIALNLPHNLASFQEVYGTTGGADLFEKFKLFYNNVIGPDPGFLPTDETYFEPVWKQQGLTVEQISPFTLEEYNAYEKARLAGALNSFKGKKPLPPNKATSWAAQTSADVIFDIVQMYADMLDVGPILCSAVILGFMDTIDDRMGISKLTYLFHAMPIIDKLMISHANIYAAKKPDSYLKTTFEELVVAYGGTNDASNKLDDELKKLKSFKGILEFIKSDPIPKAIAAWALLGVVTHWNDIIKAGSLTPTDAYVKFMEACKQDMEKAKALYIKDPSKIEYNTPPAITHLISNGMYESDEFVTVTEVCTVIDISEAQLKSS